jgi:GxxExxY protein
LYRRKRRIEKANRLWDNRAMENDVDDDAGNESRRDPETYAILGAAMEVHRVLGEGFLENVYQEALAVELELRGIPFGSQQLYQVRYKERLLNATFKPDYVCYGNVLVEIKAQQSLVPRDEGQVINYLRVTGFERALLINFGERSLKFKRIVLTKRFPKTIQSATADFADSRR